jgi:hypothetical protein
VGSPERCNLRLPISAAPVEADPRGEESARNRAAARSRVLGPTSGPRPPPAVRGTAARQEKGSGSGGKKERNTALTELSEEKAPAAGADRRAGRGRRRDFVEGELAEGAAG